MAKERKFYNKDGTLTHYGLACGYIERKEGKTHWKEMYMEHSHYHVRKGPLNGKFELWENFTDMELTKARKLYRSIKV